jgi:CO/xanthine dehydrogenase FAD-binding subunit
MSLSKLQEYYVPENGNAVIELLAKHRENAMIVAGGTFIHGLIARGLVTDVDALIDVSRLGLDFVRVDEERLWIGATTTFRQLGASPQVRDQALFGAIRDALSYPPPQVLNSATVGGCVSAACPFFDMPVSLLALSGAVSAQGAGGVREIPLQDFFQGLFQNTLQPGEFVIDLSVPIPTERSASAFMKLETNANDLAILNSAALVSVDRSGKCVLARVFVGGGVGEAPVRAISAEAVLTGHALTESLCAEAGRAARGDVEPLDDHRASAAYRKAMSGVFVERTLKKVLERLEP